MLISTEQQNKVVSETDEPIKNDVSLSWIIDNIPDDHNINALTQQQQQQKRPSATTTATTIPLSSSSSNNNNDLMMILNNDTIVCRNLTICKEISKFVIRNKLMKRRHLVIKELISSSYLDCIFPKMLSLFAPQIVNYNGGIAGITEWKISCYLEVMDGGIPTTNPSTELQHLFQPLLQVCNHLFLYWYKQQHSCSRNSRTITSCERLMTFITRYTPAPGEQALLKHVDGAGKVDGSIVVALPIDRWSASRNENQFEGGGLTFWDGYDQSTGRRPEEIHYDTRSGDVAFIDRAVWHQADPITKGTRWALVIFYKVS